MRAPIGQSMDGIIGLYAINGKRLDILKKGVLKNEEFTYNVSSLKPGIYYFLIIADKKIRDHY